MKKRKSFDVICNESFNDASQSTKIVCGGIIAEEILTTSATENFAGSNKTIRCYNTNAATQFVHVGDTGLAVPSVTTGFAIQPSTALYINTGEYDYIRTSSNDVQLIVIAE